MTSAFVSKSRKVRFDLTLRIIDLNNVPLVSGSSSVKWHLPSSTAANHRGRTHHCAIKEHRVHYAYENEIPVRLIVGKDGQLQECSIQFEIEQEYSAGGRAERITLGHIKLNLSEYVDQAETQGSGAAGASDSDHGITRRYLMQDSKINSTLRIGIVMRYIEGTRDYFAPPLRTAPVFGGIAGIIASSEPVSATHLGTGFTPSGDGEGVPVEGPSLNGLTASREMGEMQDMYRRTLAAFWSSLPGELKADECIEDIFSGGDGWGKDGRPRNHKPTTNKNSSAEVPVPGTGSNLHDNDKSPKSGHHAPHGGLSMSHRRGHFGKFETRSHGHRKGMGEVDEKNVTEDLAGWRISERALV